MRQFIALLTAVIGAGCVSTTPRAQELALAPDGIAESTPLADRNRVKVYIVNGNDPFAAESLSSLRNNLNQGGFAKVSLGGLLFVPFFDSSIRREFYEDSESRFIIIGYGFGAGTAERLAARLKGDGIPIDSVIAMAPRYFPFETTTADTDLRRIVIRGSTPAALQQTVDRTFTLDDTSNLASDVAAGELVLSMARECCASLPTATVPMMSAIAMIDDPAPLPNQRPVAVTAPMQKPVKGILTGTQLNK